MKRFAMKQLQSWKEKGKRKPMIIMGARQVGKTWLMKEFGRQFFPKVADVYKRQVQCSITCGAGSNGTL